MGLGAPVYWVRCTELLKTTSWGSRMPLWMPTLTRKPLQQAARHAVTFRTSPRREHTGECREPQVGVLLHCVFMLHCAQMSWRCLGLLRRTRCDVRVEPLVHSRARKMVDIVSYIGAWKKVDSD
jgi:hypothetical protein